jgi:YD repeat-containing protein
MNRLLQKSYYINGGANGALAAGVTYVWDSVFKGQLTSISSGVSTKNFLAYDPMGRVTKSSQVTNGQTYTFSYVYNLAGDLESESYPSGRTIQTCYDAAGRQSGVSALSSSTAYASAVTYAPHGAMSAATIGNR